MSSIDVRFALSDADQERLASAHSALHGKRVFGVIWTTTPWTLPANLALAFHPEADYAFYPVEGTSDVILIAKASVLCARLGVGRLALGPLAGNPFPDARPEFFATMAQALSIGLDRPFEIVTPLAHLHKEQVVTLGVRSRQAPGEPPPVEDTGGPQRLGKPAAGRRQHLGRAGEVKGQHLV